MFSCKACPCKDAHIKSLQDEVANLRRLVIPSESAGNVLPVIHLEADAILSGSQEVMQISDKELKKQAEDANSEVSAILSGSY